MTKSTDKLAGVFDSIRRLTTMSSADKLKGINTGILDAAIEHLGQYNRLVTAMRQNDWNRKKVSSWGFGYLGQDQDFLKNARESGETILEFLKS